MRSAQREPGGFVIESLHIQPGIVAMAPFAFLAKLPLVGVGRLVTIKAKTGCIAKLDSLRVAVAAGRRLVRAKEDEIRHCMIERLAIELNDIGSAALVIGVTRSAFLFRRVRLAPVKAPARQPIRSNLFVARKTQVALRLSRKWHVTL